MSGVQPLPLAAPDARLGLGHLLEQVGQILRVRTTAAGRVRQAIDVHALRMRANLAGLVRDDDASLLAALREELQRRLDGHVVLELDFEVVASELIDVRDEFRVVEQAEQVVLDRA